MVPQSELDLDLVKTILAEYRISNADIALRFKINRALIYLLIYFHFNIQDATPPLTS